MVNVLTAIPRKNTKTGKTTSLSVRFAIIDRPVRLNLALHQIPTIQEKNLVLTSIVSGYRDALCKTLEEDNFLDQWVRDKLEETLNTLDTVEVQDGRALISIGKKHARELLLNQ